MSRCRFRVPSLAFELQKKCRHPKIYRKNDAELLKLRRYTINYNVYMCCKGV